MNKLLTVDAVSEILGIKRSTLDQWRCAGSSSLRWVCIGGTIRYKEAEVNDFIERSSTGSPQPILSVNIPAVYSVLPNRTTIKKKEFAEILGVPVRTISRLILKGVIPPPINDRTARQSAMHVWTLGSIRSLKIRSSQE